MMKRRFCVKMLAAILCFSLFMGCSTVSADKETSEEALNPVNSNPLDRNLCRENEENLFRFDVENTAQTVSVCVSEKEHEYIVFRYGTSDDIVLEYPQEKDDSWNGFTYSYYVRGGGEENEGVDLNCLFFESDGFKYEIYQEYSAKEKETEIGLKKTDLNTGKEEVLKGLNKSARGSLIRLRDNDKIKKTLE